MRNHPYPCSPNAFDGYYHYFALGDYDIEISKFEWVGKPLHIVLPFTNCLSGACAICALYGPRVTLNNSPSERETSSSGCRIRRCTNFIFPSATICGRYKSLWNVSGMDLKRANMFPYLSSALHSVSGNVFIPIWGQAGQNKARPPSTGLSGRSWATPARMRLWRSLHCLDIRRSSR